MSSFLNYPRWCKAVHEWQQEDFSDIGGNEEDASVKEFFEFEDIDVVQELELPLLFTPKKWYEV